MKDENYSLTPVQKNLPFRVDEPQLRVSLRDSDKYQL